MDVEKVIAEMAEAWNAGDGDAWAAPFSDDAVFVDVLGRAQRGRAVIAREHQKIFDTIYRGSQLEIRLVACRSIAHDVVLAHTTSTMHVPSGPRAGVTQAIQTKIISAGLIVSFHNTIRTDMAQFAAHDPDLAALSPLEWQGRAPRMIHDGKSEVALSRHRTTTRRRPPPPSDRLVVSVRIAP